MTELLVTTAQQATISQGETVKITVPAEAQASLALVLATPPEAVVELEGNIGENSTFTLLVIDHGAGRLTLKETWDIGAQARVKIAQSQLADHDAAVESGYRLNGRGAELVVQTASLTKGKRTIEQDCRHLGAASSADLRNYGVVLPHGDCQMVVKNTIAKGVHGCRTYQTSRLLTNDATARGKILPILYIDDDQVQAGHAASLGQPSAGQLYYLQSRGLSRSQALRLIVTGYLMPVTEILQDEQLNRTLAAEIETKVSQECTM
jgi:Fe-S cluster assembly scaffold protein SufB